MVVWIRVLIMMKMSGQIWVCTGLAHGLDMRDCWNTRLIYWKGEDRGRETGVGRAVGGAGFGSDPTESCYFYSIRQVGNWKTTPTAIITPRRHQGSTWSTTPALYPQGAKNWILKCWKTKTEKPHISKARFVRSNSQKLSPKFSLSESNWQWS